MTHQGDHMARTREGQSDSIEPRIVPIYVPGSMFPELEWVNEPEEPGDWTCYVDDGDLPTPILDDADSVAEWRIACARYLSGLEEASADWRRYQEAVKAAR